MPKSLSLFAVVVAMSLPLTSAMAQTPADAQFQPLRDARRAPASAQIRISVALTDVTLEEALREITRRAGIGLSYRSDLPALDRRVTLRADSMPAAEALLRVLRGAPLQLMVGANGRTMMLAVIPPRTQPDTIAARTSVADTMHVIPLADIVVTPGHFGIAHEAVSRAQTLTRAQIETLPQLGDDIYRTVNRLPGLGSHEFKAHFTVRGGDDESLLVTLDGLELFEPYHLKDLDGALSILDVAAIGGVDLTTGGFGAAHGNHLTGIFDLRTTNRITPRPRTQVGISLSNVRVLSQGSFSGDNGLWLFSARRGYLDLLLKLAKQEADMDPRYYDMLGKVVYQLSPRHRVSVHALHAGDQMTLRDDDDSGELRGRYGSSYAWLTWHAKLTDRLAVETLASTGYLDWNRDAQENDTGEHFEIRDARDFGFVGLRQDWHLEVTDALLLRGGFELRRARASYDYFRMKRRRFVTDHTLQTRYDTISIALEPRGSEVGAYLLQRVRPWQPLTIEAGLRWDRQTHTDESQLSPRLNAALALGNRTVLRGGWGRYAQPQRLHQLNVQDGVDAFAPSERANQLVAGIERDMGAGIRVRTELYRRTEFDLRPRYLNLSTYTEPVAEIEADRFRADRTDARAEGVELLVQRNRADGASWSVSYALARAEDEIGGNWVPRVFEQRHTFSVDHSFVPKRNWRMSWTWQLHSGWPATESIFVVDTVGTNNLYTSVQFGEYHAERLPSYHRMDLRISRDVPLRNGRLNFFVDVFNVYDRDNAQSYSYDVRFRNGVIMVDRYLEPMLPRMPSFGVLWEF